MNSKRDCDVNNVNLLILFVCQYLSRDASCGPSSYSLMLIDCLRGMHKVCYNSVYVMSVFWSFFFYK